MTGDRPDYEALAAALAALTAALDTWPPAVRLAADAFERALAAAIDSEEASDGRR